MAAEIRPDAALAALQPGPCPSFDPPSFDPPSFDPLRDWDRLPPPLQRQLVGLFLAEFVGSTVSASLDQCPALDSSAHSAVASAAHRGIVRRLESTPLLRLISEASLPDISAILGDKAPYIPGISSSREPESRSQGGDQISRPQDRRDGSPSRVWQRFLSGRQLDLLDPSPDGFEPADLARGLAREPRWRGATLGPHAYSVAQHCLDGHRAIDLIVPEIHRSPLLHLAWHLHDSPEGLAFGDQTTPTKVFLGHVYRSIDAQLQICVHRKFGLPPALPADLKSWIKKIDRHMAATEALQLAGYGSDEIASPDGLDNPERPLDMILTPVSAEEAEHLWLARLLSLLQT